VASDSRALTLKLLADTADFQKKLANGSKDIDSIGDRAKEFGVKAAAAFASAAAAIGAFAKVAIENAAKDEAAQRTLAQTIENTTKATAEQIAGVEEYISITSVAIGVTDDQLRPAFSRLVRSTKDVEQAQKLLNLSLDIASATGKPLEAVANALGKAYDGNLNALGRLGLGLDQSIIQSKDFDLVFNDLTKTFGGFAANEAQSTEKQIDRVKIALDEATESIGAALLPVVQELTAWILADFIPALNGFIAGLTGKDSLNESLTESQKTAVEWGKKVRGFIDTVIDLKDELLIVAGVLATVFVVSKIAAGIQATILLIQGLVVAYNLLRNSAVAAAIASRFALNPLAGLATGAAVVGAIIAATKLFDNQADAAASTGSNTVPASSLPSGFAAGPPVISGGSGASTGGGIGGGKIIAPIVTGTMPSFPSGLNPTGNAIPSGFDVAAARRGEERGNVIINVNAPSAIDEEGFTRAVVLAMNNSQSRTGSGASQFRDR
jgi:hypothetical protein